MFRRLLSAISVFALVNGCAGSLGQNGVYVAQNGLQVLRGSDASQFEVITTAGASGEDLFCAAGDYAIARLGAHVDDRVLVISPLAPSLNEPNRRSAVFRLSPREEGLKQTSIFLLVGKSGQNIPVGHARFMCDGTS